MSKQGGRARGRLPYRRLGVHRRSACSRGEILVRYAEEPSLWRVALPRAGGWRNAPRWRLPTRPLRPRQSKRDAGLKRQPGLQSRSGSRITSGVFLSVIGAGQYGTSTGCDKSVPHFDAQEWRQSLPQGMAPFRTTGKEGVRGVARSGIQRAKKLAV